METSPFQNNPKVIRAWCLYDWANSVYNLIVNTAIFPVYYASVTRSHFGSDNIKVLGFEVSNSVAYTYALSYSYFIIVFLSFLLSGLADYSGRRRLFMQIFTYVGAISCMMLYFFEGHNVEWGLFFVITASIGYAGSLVFYNSFLPEIVTPDKLDSVSARGFSYGYIGSLILLIINLLMVMQPAWFGLSDARHASKISFLMVGIWWIGFAQFAFLALKPYEKPTVIQGFMFLEGIREWFRTLKIVLHSKNLIWFLASFFFLSMGVQTIILLASLFGEKEVKMESTELIVVIIIVQVIAILGAWLFAKISNWKNTKISVMIALVLWFFLCFRAYFVVEKWSFFALAGLLGLVMGGIQSQSRSFYSKLLPDNHTDTASFFSFYDILEKFAIVIGTFSYGTVENLTGSLRNSILAMSIFFVISFVFLSLIKTRIKL